MGRQPISRVRVYHGRELDAVGRGRWGVFDNRDDKRGTLFIRRYETLEKARNAAKRRADDIVEPVAVMTIEETDQGEMAFGHSVVHSIYAYDS